MSKSSPKPPSSRDLARVAALRNFDAIMGSCRAMLAVLKPYQSAVRLVDVNGGGGMTPEQMFAEMAEGILRMVIGNLSANGFIQPVGGVEEPECPAP